MISNLTTCYISQVPTRLVRLFSTWTSQSSPTHNVPTFTAVSLPLPRSVLLLPTVRALAMWVFQLHILQKFTSYCPQHKAAATTKATAIVTNFHSSISVVLSSLLAIVSKKSDQSIPAMWYTFFSRAFSLNFQSSMWQS